MDAGSLSLSGVDEKFMGASLARSGIRAMEDEKVATLAAAARSGGVL